MMAQLAFDCTVDHLVPAILVGHHLSSRGGFLRGLEQRRQPAPLRLGENLAIHLGHLDE